MCLICYGRGSSDRLGTGGETSESEKNLREADERLLEPVGDPTAAEVVGGKLYGHTIALENSDVVLAHPPRNVGEYVVAILELHPEVGVGEDLRDGALHLDCFFCQEGSPLAEGRPRRPEHRKYTRKAESRKEEAPLFASPPGRSP